MRFAVILLAALAWSTPSQADQEDAQAILSELKCQRPPKAGTVLAKLVRGKAIDRKPSTIFDSVNVFRLLQPITVDGLKVVAVFGYEEDSDFPFVRGPGTSPGNVFGVATTSSLYAVDQWRSRVSRNLDLDEGNAGIPGTKELTCSKLAER